MTEPDHPTLVMRLHLEHPNAIVQLLSDCSNLVYEYNNTRKLRRRGVLSWSWFAATGNDKQKVGKLGAPENEEKRQRTVVGEPDCVRVVCADISQAPVAALAELGMTIANGRPPLQPSISRRQILGGG